MLPLSRHFSGIDLASWTDIDADLMVMDVVL